MYATKIMVYITAYNSNNYSPFHFDIPLLSWKLILGERIDKDTYTARKAILALRSIFKANKRVKLKHFNYGAVINFTWSS